VIIERPCDSVNGKQQSDRPNCIRVRACAVAGQSRSKLFNRGRRCFHVTCIFRRTNRGGRPRTASGAFHAAREFEQDRLADVMQSIVRRRNWIRAGSRRNIITRGGLPAAELQAIACSHEIALAISESARALQFARPERRVTDRRDEQLEKIGRQTEEVRAQLALETRGAAKARPHRARQQLKSAVKPGNAQRETFILLHESA